MSEIVYSVYWSETAQRDLSAILEYIAHDSKAVAGHIYKSIKNTAAGLKELPHRGRIVPELHAFSVLSYRELVVSSWRIIYRIESDRVIVFAVIDSRRNVEDVLLGRLL